MTVVIITLQSKYFFFNYPIKKYIFKKNINTY